MGREDTLHPGELAKLLKFLRFPTEIVLDLERLNFNPNTAFARLQLLNLTFYDFSISFATYDKFPLNMLKFRSILSQIHRL